MDKGKLTGITSKSGNNYLISQFADDISFAITNDPTNMDYLFYLLDLYGNIADLKMNINKTEILLLGNTIQI